MRQLTTLDRLLAAAERGLRTVAAEPSALRPRPGSQTTEGPLSTAERHEAAALMRVNHVGEICAQALYDAQALAAHDPEVRDLFERSAAEETDHLAWTQERIRELGGRVSLLNPLWYGGSFAIGMLAARAGDRFNLGFMAETERQVEAHLQSHLERLPPEDARSRSVIEAMKADEARHAESALHQGGAELPLAVRWAMRAAAKVMTATARRI